MSKPESKTSKGRMELRLRTEPFLGLTEELVQWRLDPIIRLMETTKDRGRILGFVKGLRLSARILYILRTIVSSQKLEVSWGHLVDDEGILETSQALAMSFEGGLVTVLEWLRKQNALTKQELRTLLIAMVSQFILLNKWLQDHTKS